MYNQLLEPHAPTDVALIEGDRQVTYGQLRDLVAETAGSLRAIGVVRGDRVAVLGANDIGFVTGFLAAHHLGAVACPMTARNPLTVVTERLTALDPRALLVSPVAAELATSLIENGSIAAGNVGTPAGSPAPGIAPLPEGEPAAAADVGVDDTAAILHTSGIVGAPRAAVLTHGNLAAAQQRIVGLGPGLTSADSVLAVLPLTHVLGLNMCLLPGIRSGATVVLQPDWGADEALELVARHQVTHLVGVPPMWSAWVAAAEADERLVEATASVTFARTGASTLHQNVAESVHRVFGLELAQGYGLTETAGTVTFENLVRTHPGSVGRPLPDVELKLVEDGEEVEPGDRGEVWIRTASVFPGYVNDAAATAEVLISDGWCRTGDVGIQDDDGTLYLVGRSKDLINVSGFNVYPAEVEAVLEDHPTVAGAVVVGEPHQVTGERVIAYVTAQTGEAVDAEVLRLHCRERLSRYKIPASFHVVDRLPLTSTGKRVRSELR